MAQTERSLTELLQAAQHMTAKADMPIGCSSLAKRTAASHTSSASAGPMEVAVDDLPRVDRSLAQLVQVRHWSFNLCVFSINLLFNNCLPIKIHFRYLKNLHLFVVNIEH